MGDVDAATIYTSPPSEVIAQGPVLVRKGTSSCPVPIPRPAIPTALLLYIPENKTAESCDLTQIPESFAFNVEIDRCYSSPEGVDESVFEDLYYKVHEGNLFFYNDADCSKNEIQKQLFMPCNPGWSAIFLPSSPLL